MIVVAMIVMIAAGAGIGLLISTKTNGKAADLIFLITIGAGFGAALFLAILLAFVRGCGK